LRISYVRIIMTRNPFNLDYVLYFIV